MPTLKTLSEIWFGFAVLAQVALLWLQLRAFGRYGHRSFLILAAGTTIGLGYSALALLMSLGPSAVSSPKQTYVSAMILGLIQFPVVLWGIVLLFRSYGQLYERNLATVSAEARE